ncbi:MAG: hypothetical protein Q9227_002492 [Pyrenula ochraceoflavens]
MDPRVGDSVDVPGGMWGTVKFVGVVQGKKGTFCGVQLAPEFASRGKNSGDVDGKSYFRTATPGSGIFLPVEKASRRAPATPQAPSLSNFNVRGRTPSTNKFSQSTSKLGPPVSKFSQSVGPGARAASPTFKPTPRRPSLPRPGSPLRKPTLTATTTAPKPSPALTKSRIGTSTRGVSGSTPSPRVSNLSASFRRPSSNTPSKKPPLGPEAAFDEDDSTPTPTPIGVARTIDHVVQDEEVKRLKQSLEEKDRQLKQQASALADMESSLSELQSLLPGDGRSPEKARPSPAPESTDAAQLRALLREKNEKIAMLTAEFDTHRADFRSTIDTLEMASTETERVYEKRVDELLQEIRELQERGGQDRGEDIASVAQQLKQLEELVQELEEGLEDARRGEAEARAEVEFLRGEVERGKSELRREKEKAAAALKEALSGGSVNTNRNSGRDIEQRDDEIRGLKAIIHGLSRDSMLSPPGVNGHSSMNGVPKDDNDPVARLSQHIEVLESALERKSYREEELEREIEHLRNANTAQHQVHVDKHKSAGTVGSSHRLSDRTVVQGDWREHARANSATQPRMETMHEDTHSTVTDGSQLWCEICEEYGHDVLNCPGLFSGNGNSNNTNSRPNHNAQPQQRTPPHQRTGRDVVIEGLKNLSPRSQHNYLNNNHNTPPPAQPAASPPVRSSPYNSNSHTASYDEHPSSHSVNKNQTRTQDPVTTPKAPASAKEVQNPMEVTNNNTNGMVPGKSGTVDEDAWCAMCERDGHSSVDCPYDGEPF